MRGSIANESDTEFGFSRLEANAEKAYQCLEPKHCKPSGCAGGRTAEDVVVGFNLFWRLGTVHVLLLVPSVSM